MIRRLVSFPVLIVALLLCFQVAAGQQSSSNTKDKAADAELRQKAFELLESLAGQISTLQSAENRARMGSTIAASLWAHDENRARALFKLVEDDIKLGLQVNEQTPYGEHTFQVFFKLREDTAERMAQLDPEMALAFLKDTFPLVEEYAALPSGGLLPSIAQKEHQLQTRLMRRVGDKNSEVAVALARESLRNGFSRELVSVLRKASKADAVELYKEIVNKLSDVDLDNWQNAEFAQYLVERYTPPAADQSTYRNLIGIVLAKMSEIGCGNRRPEHDHLAGICSQMGALIPLMEKFYPAAAQRFRHWLPEDGSHISVRHGYAEVNEIAETGTIDEVLSLTSKYPEIEALIRHRAILMAEAAGDLEKAEKIASEFNGDPQVRERLTQRVKSYKNLEASAEQQWTAAVKNVSELPLWTQTNLLLGLGHDIALRDKATGLKALARLSGMIDSLPPGKEQTAQQIVLAMSYCLTKSDRGFAIIEGLLPKLNELVAAGAKLDGYDARYLRDGEWNMTAEGATGNLLTILANNAAYFAWCDFDRAVTLASQFERSEIRMMAQLKLAQGILAGPPKRALGNHRIY